MMLEVDGKFSVEMSTKSLMVSAVLTIRLASGSGPFLKKAKLNKASTIQVSEFRSCFLRLFDLHRVSHVVEELGGYFESFLQLGVQPKNDHSR